MSASEWAAFVAEPQRAAATATLTSRLGATTVERLASLVITKGDDGVAVVPELLVTFPSPEEKDHRRQVCGAAPLVIRAMQRS
jgi:hypothetical protein